MINELKEGKVSLPCLITKCEMGRTAKGTPYLSLTLEDSSGVLDAKFWNLTEEQAGKYASGQIVQAEGDLIFHRNAAQLRVRHLNVLENEDMLEYVRSAPASREAMREEVLNLVDSMKDEQIQAVTLGVLERAGDKFYIYPAATKNHHNFVGGLAWHTLTMARAAQALLPLYPFLDRDLLLAGILLHDLGKTEELSDPILPEYTTTGNLVGHISLASGWIDEAAAQAGVQDEETIALLKHMVLSHHGKLEYGSPVLPMVPEAEMLTLLDNMDARMFMMKQSLDAVMPGHFGPRVFALENRMMYRRKEKKE
jgi:3'-5' exoribonuclease